MPYSAITRVSEVGSLRRVVNAVREFRIIPRIETFPSIVSFVQTGFGKVILLAVFGLGLRIYFPDLISELSVMFPLALMTFMPEYRRFLLAITPITLLLLKSYREPLVLGMTVLVIATGILLYICAIRWPNSRFGQRPVTFLLTGFSVLIVGACLTQPHSVPHSVLWSAVGAFASNVWFIGYALADRKSKPATDLTLQLGTFRPLWGSTGVPFPKGASNLRRIEARDPAQLAVTQLKGLKLLVWAILLMMLFKLWNHFFHSYLLIPTAAQALDMSARGTPGAWHLCWESQILSFFEDILIVSYTGNWFIALCRIAGFNALRNTYRPLSSTSIAEFFNRYYYYFKELVVEFFFFPAFFRYWKGRPKIRLAFATFSSACFGNLFYHFTRDWEMIRDAGLLKAITNYQVFFFYTATLATMLSFSQIRRRGPKPKGVVRSRIVPAFGVGLFFCLLNIFGRSEQIYPLAVHLKYLASLFFIHL
jgi:hypothetical protein